MEHDDNLATKLSDLRRNGGTAALRELLPGDWDTVHILLGPRTKQGIERVLGQPVELQGAGVYRDTYMQDGNLLVLTKHGRTVRMVGTGQLAALGTGTFPARTVLKAEGGRIRILDPAPSPSTTGATAMPSAARR